MNSEPKKKTLIADWIDEIRNLSAEKFKAEMMGTVGGTIHKTQQAVPTRAYPPSHPMRANPYRRKTVFTEQLDCLLSGSPPIADRMATQLDPHSTCRFDGERITLLAGLHAIKNSCSGTQECRSVHHIQDLGLSISFPLGGYTTYFTTDFYPMEALHRYVAVIHNETEADHSQISVGFCHAGNIDFGLAINFYSDNDRMNITRYISTNDPEQYMVKGIRFCPLWRIGQILSSQTRSNLVLEIERKYTVLLPVFRKETPKGPELNFADRAITEEGEFRQLPTPKRAAGFRFTKETAK